MPEKLCLFCQHFMCSDESNRIACTKENNSLPYFGLPKDENKFRQLMLYAQKCGHYEKVSNH